MTVIFDGKRVARAAMAELGARVAELPRAPQIVSIYFREDSGSLLYTQKKREAAEEIGIKFAGVEMSLADSVEEVVKKLQEAEQSELVTGIMVQKPTRKVYDLIRGDSRLSYEEWWQTLTAAIPYEKDVDGLSRELQERLKRGEKTRVLPATVSAVLEILETAGGGVGESKILILGRSDLLGKPLYFYWKNQGKDVTLMGKSELARQRELPQKLREYGVIVSATGVAGLITGELVTEGATLIDVGEPEGDLEWASCVEKAGFITPVPGGVGPMTVVELMKNAVVI